MRQFTSKERELTEKTVNKQKEKLQELQEQVEYNDIKINFLDTQREYQDKVRVIEQKQEDKMFNNTIKMLEAQYLKDPSKRLSTTIEYNSENYTRIVADREFKEKWTPLMRSQADEQTTQTQKELQTDINTIAFIIDTAEDQLENGVPDSQEVKGGENEQ